ncbi:MAG TPA: hypothetical protein DEA96_03915, partial [Leptospiraceae bacterium]|nr:hypothetical protein [Leptospiraceae bacterium]
MSENSLIKPAGEIPDELIISQETLAAGNHCSVVLHRGYAIRLTDLDGNANVSALFFNRDEKTERYNMPDTLKAQYTAYLT